MSSGGGLACEARSLSVPAAMENHLTHRLRHQRTFRDLRHRSICDSEGVVGRPDRREQDTNLLSFFYLMLEVVCFMSIRSIKP